MSAYTAWVADVKALLVSLYGDNWRLHGGPVVMPSNVPPLMQPYVGLPAVMLDNETYAALGNGGYLDMNQPQVASNNGKSVFILARDDVIAAAPRTMTAAQRLANAVYTGADIAATNLGAPSLADLGKYVKWGAIGLAGVAGLVLVSTFMPRRNPPRRRRSRARR